MGLPRRLPVRAAAGALIVSGALLALALAPGDATSASSSTLSSQIAAQQAAEQQLRAAIAAEDHRLALVHGSLSSVEGQLNAIEADLAAKQARLAETQLALRQARAHLVQLQLQLDQADRALAANLLSQFETDRPDAITVILQAHGFADMMDRLEFVRQAKRYDQQLIAADRRARVVVIATATQLGALAVHEQALATQVRERRNAVDRIRIALLNRSIAIEQARSAKTASLDRARAQRRHLEAQLAALSPPAASSGSSVPVSGVLRSGNFVFPMPAGAAVGPGSWSLDQGVDIAAGGGTPLLAVCSGTIVLHGIGGFGPSAPVLHCDSSLGGYDYVYYGHAGPGNMVAVGTHVGAGSVISEVGSGIVGISTGPHLEIGFADASGSPVGAGSAGTMMSLLQGAYHG